MFDDARVMECDKLKAEVMKMKGYCGTYTTGRGEGIYTFELDEKTGQLSNLVCFAKVQSAKTIAVEGEYIFSVFENAEGAGVCVLDRSGKILDSLVIEKSTSCHIAIKDNHIFTANYHEGLFSVCKWQDEKLTLAFQDKVQEKAGCHQVMFVEDMILVPCLFLDQIVVYDNQFKQMARIETPKGVGPRNGVYNDKTKELMVLCELSNELLFYHFENGHFIYDKKSTILENDETFFMQSSALRMNHDRTLFFAGTRGKDQISVVDCKGEIKQIVSTQGKHPREFVLSPNGRFLIVANKDSDTLVSFPLNEKIEEACSTLDVFEPVSIAWEKSR